MMTFVDGFVASVPTAKKQTFIDFVRKAVPLFKEYGASRIVECWGEDVPDGKLTDFKRAVQASDGETVVFSWVEWPSREVRDAGMAKMREDPRMKDMSDMPFDGKRMIFGGFAPVVDE
jgi:uncharacterized protein YbaA (DUF1428 family)